jgi:hypothetical protein
METPRSPPPTWPGTCTISGMRVAASKFVCFALHTDSTPVTALRAPRGSCQGRTPLVVVAELETMVSP